jgi:hypothetical protein
MASCVTVSCIVDKVRYSVEVLKGQHFRGSAMAGLKDLLSDVCGEGI